MPWKKPWTPDIQKRTQQLKAEARERAKKEGRCTSCMRRQAIPGRSRCRKCARQRGEYYRANRKRIIAAACANEKKNWRRRRVYLRERARRKRLEAIQKLGGKCVQCGFTDQRALQFDHKKGGGHQELRRGRKGYIGAAGVVRKILTGSKKYDLLCANCNWIKRAENNEI